MSVLVEALSLIIPRKVLDVSYPGGTKAFLQKMEVVPSPCRCACSDEMLVSVSFFGVADATVVGDQLLELGIVAVDNDRFYEMAFIDQAKGPTMRCDWIEWTRHAEGYTSCWLVGSEPGPFRAPAGWTPKQSRDLTFHDIRSEPGRCIKLADEPDGTEVWLDYQTGEIAPGYPYEPDLRNAIEPPSASPDAPSNDRMQMSKGLGAGQPSLASTVRAMLDSRKYKYQPIDDRSLTLSFQNERGSYGLFFTTNDESDFVGLTATYGSKIPDDRLVPISEALSRINHRLWLGNFELDFSNGQLRFRVGIDVEDGRLSETMVSNLLSATLNSMERYHVALMRIAFGEVEPAVALAEAA
jgi:hypothetical protein